MIEYKSKIDSALSSIMQNPYVGRTFDRNGLRVLPVGRHQIFYLIKGVNVYVVRILHDRMDASHHLGES